MNKTNKKSAMLRQIYVTFIVNLLSVSNGISGGWSSVAEPIFKQARNPISDNSLSEHNIAWIASSLYVGGLIGLFIWSGVADKYGRKMSGYLLAGTQISSWTMIMVAKNETMIISARVLMGIGGSGIVVQSQMYVNEIATGKLKNTLSCFSVVFMNIGLLLVNATCFFFGYKITNYVCLTVPIVFLMLFVWVPETPHYWQTQNKLQEARESHLWYSGDDQHVTDNEVEQLKIPSSWQEQQQYVNGGYRDLLQSWDSVKTLVIVAVIFVGQQLSGNSIVTAYTVSIFEESGSKIRPEISTIIVLSAYVFVSCFSSFTINLFPKRNLLAASFLGAAISFAIFYAHSVFKNNLLDWTIISYIPTLSMIAFFICYNIGIGPIPYAISLQLFSPHIFSKGLAVVLILGMLASFFTVFKALENNFSNLALMGSCSNLLLSYFVFKFVKCDCKK